MAVPQLAKFLPNKIKLDLLVSLVPSGILTSKSELLLRMLYVMTRYLPVLKCVIMRVEHLVPVWVRLPPQEVHLQEVIHLQVVPSVQEAADQSCLTA